MRSSAEFTGTCDPEAVARVAVDNTVATPVLTRPFEFGGGCQGCSLADVTDHEAGTEPFFSAEKR